MLVGVGIEVTHTCSSGGIGYELSQAFGWKMGIKPAVLDTMLKRYSRTLYCKYSYRIARE